MTTSRQDSNYVQFTFRLDKNARLELKEIAKFERSGTPSEVVRKWVTQAVNSYRGNKGYNAWKERKLAEAKLG